MQARFIKSAAGADGFPPDTGVEAAFVGRSNSGKSSAINRIVGQTKLARVSKTPGRTQLINFFDLGENRRLVDLPGYGFAKVPEKLRLQWGQLVQGYFGNRRSLAALFLTADIRRGLNEADHRMLGWAAELKGRVVILLTKSDKLSRGAGSSRCLELGNELGPAIEVIRFSALDGTGVTEARERLLECLDPARA